MKITTPPEPKEVKAWMQELKNTTFSDPTIDWDSYVVWAGNQLPKYLWSQWKDELKPLGFTWQKFLKLLRLRTDNMLLWYRGVMPWPRLVGTITELIEGPLGKELGSRK